MVVTILGDHEQSTHCSWTSVSPSGKWEKMILRFVNHSEICPWEIKEMLSLVMCFMNYTKVYSTKQSWTEWDKFWQVSRNQHGSLPLPDGYR